MKTTFSPLQSTSQFLPFGYAFSQKNDHLGVRNTNTLEQLMDGLLQREYYFQTRSFGNVYLSVVSKLHISDQTWNAFMGTFAQDLEVESFINDLLNQQYDPELVGLIGNNLPKYPEIIGLVVMGETIYNG